MPEGGGRGTPVLRRKTRKPAHLYLACNIPDLNSHGVMEAGQTIKAKGRETTFSWLLWLWDNGADNTQLTPQEKSQAASIANIHSRRVLQDVQKTAPEAGYQTVISWLVAMSCLAWWNPGDLLEQVTKWTSCLALVSTCGMRSRHVANDVHAAVP